MLNMVSLRRLLRVGLAAPLAAAVVVAGGCVTTGAGLPSGIGVPFVPSLAGLRSGDRGEAAAADQANLTPAERRMREQSKAFQRTVWEGALLGAGAGAAWGLLAGDKAEDVLKKTLIGGAVGGLAGAYIGQKQKQFASTEDQLESMTADVRRSNRETEELIASVKEVIAEDRRRLASVQQQVKAGTASEAELVATRQRIAENRAVVAQAAKGAREQYSMYRGAEQGFRKQNPGTSTGALQQELDAYNSQIDTLDGLADSIAVA